MRQNKRSNGAITRREFVAAGLAGAAAWSAFPAGVFGFGLRTEPVASGQTMNPADLFPISLAEWSLHRALWAEEITNLDFPVVTRRRFDIGAVEYVNSFFGGQGHETSYLAELMSRCDGEGIRNVLIMVDGVGRLGDPDPGRRTQAIENHQRWIDSAKLLGCHSIRVNAESEGDPDTQRDLVADGLRRLSEYGADRNLNVLVENHGGLSSNGAWLAAVMRQVDHENCGTLPDFGNFMTSPGQWYDRYRGVEEMMPFARAVSAKSFDFDEEGNERRTDYRRMMRIVLDAGYRSFVGIEYEGEELDEDAGILATKALLETVRTELSASYQ